MKFHIKYNKQKVTLGYFLIFMLISSSFLIYSFIHSEVSHDKVFFPLLPKEISMNQISLKDYDKNWKKVENLNITHKLNPKYSYSFDFNLPDADYTQYLAINLLYTEFELKCGNDLIYTNSNFKNDYFKSIRRAFNLIPINKKYLKKTLTINFKSTLGNFRKLNFPSISYGSKHALVSYYFNKGKTSIFFGIFFIISSFFILLSTLFFIRINRTINNIIAIGAFTFNIGLYICLRSWIPFYFLQNDNLIYFLDYTSAITMPLPLYILFINRFEQEKYFNFRTNLLKLGALITFMNLIFEYICILFKINEFVYFQKFTFSWIFFSSFFIFTILLSADKKIIKNKFSSMLSIAPMILSSLITILVYFKSFKISTSSIIILSIAFFIFTNFIFFIKTDLEHYNKILENDFYAHLAYNDYLTHLKNRNALMDEIEKINKKEIKFKSISIFMIDMNFLKQINDKLGHSIGDLYLKQIGKILIVIEQSFNNTYAYRYGGDEFLIIAYDTSFKKLKKIEDTLSILSHKFNTKFDCPLSLAIGYVFENNSPNLDFAKLLSEADEAMYEDKQKKKNIQNKEINK